MERLLRKAGRSTMRSARREAEGDAQSSVAALEGKTQALALADPAALAVGAPAERRQALGIECLDGGPRHLARRLDLDDAALRLVEDDERRWVVAEAGHQGHVLGAGEE